MRGLDLLYPSERRSLGVLIAVVIVGGLSSAVMVASVLPFLTVISNPATIHEVPALSRAYDLLGFTSDYAFLVALGLASLAVIFLANLLQILRTYVVNRFTTMRMHSISRRLLSQYLHQPYTFFLSEHSTAMSTKILNETSYVVNFFFRPAADVAASGVTILAIGAVVISVNPKIALAASAMLAGFYLVFYLFARKRLARLGVTRARMNKERFRVVGEALSGIKNIKLTDSEPVAMEQYNRYCKAMTQSHMKMQLMAEVPQYIIQTVAFGGIIVLCLLMLDPRSLADGATLKDMLPILGVFAFAGQRLLPELTRFYRGLSQLRYGQAAVDSIYEDLILRLEPVEETRVDMPPLHLKGNLTLEGVTYRYPGAEQPSLRDVSLSIRAGEKIGIVGGSGAGKTTLADIVLGVLQPDSGAMSVDGRPLTPDLLPAWRKNVGYVPQDVFLLDASVAENIALSVDPKSISDEQIRRAAQSAQIDQVVESMSDGYRTPIGERGVRLSGGQRQRVGIARALYRQGDLIIFDEATSALDTLTEKDVMAAIDALPGDQTVIIIAHRLTTVQGCDRIIVMDHGRVAGFDTWDRLEAGNAIFRSLLNAPDPE